MQKEERKMERRKQRKLSDKHILIRLQFFPHQSSISKHDLFLDMSTKKRKENEIEGLNYSLMHKTANLVELLLTQGITPDNWQSWHKMINPMKAKNIQRKPQPTTTRSDGQKKVVNFNKFPNYWCYFVLQPFPKAIPHFKLIYVGKPFYMWVSGQLNGKRRRKVWTGNWKFKGGQ